MNVLEQTEADNGGFDIGSFQRSRGSVDRGANIFWSAIANADKQNACGGNTFSTIGAEHFSGLRLQVARTERQRGQF